MPKKVDKVDEHADEGLRYKKQWKLIRLLEKVGLLYELDKRKTRCKGIEDLFHQEKLRKFWELLWLVLQV